MKPFAQIGLLILAICLSPLLLLGFVYSLIKFCFRAKFRTWWRSFGNYCEALAKTIDQSGNVVCQELFNDTLIKDDSISFGNEDEKISSVMGKNKVIDNLTWMGKFVDLLFELFDKNHSVESIDNTV